MKFLLFTMFIIKHLKYYHVPTINTAMAADMAVN